MSNQNCVNSDSSLHVITD